MIARLALSFLVAFFLYPVSAFAEITVTDLAGRQVTLQKPARHIVLGEGRYLPTLAILEGEEVFERIAGMMGDFKKYDPASWAQYEKLYPEINDIPLIGGNGGISFSVEKAFSVRPDLAIFGLSSGHGPSDKNKTVMDQFAAAGIPVVILDFRLEPVLNTPKSMKILGRLLGREERASEFLDFYDSHLDIIAKRLEGVTQRPRVFMETHVGLRPDCCFAFGNAMMGRFISLVGGTNAYGDILPGTAGRVNVEHLVSNQPDIYIGTAIGSSLSVKETPRFIALGAGTEAELARTSLLGTTERTGIKQLRAIRENRGYAIWHHFYNTPMNIAAAEIMAKWIHPELFSDLEPEKTLQEYFDRFQPVPLDGVYWIGMTE